MLPAYRPATSWVHYTTSCNTQSSAPEDRQNNCLKHIELIGIINKPLLLQIVGCLYYLQLCAFVGWKCSNSVLLVNSHYYSTSEQYSNLVPVTSMSHNPGNCHCRYVRHFLFSYYLFFFTSFTHFFVGCIPMRYERFHDEIWEWFIILTGTSHFFLYICTEQQWMWIIQVDLICYSFSFNIKLGKAPDLHSKSCTLNTCKHKRTPLMFSLISFNRSAWSLWLAHYGTRIQRCWQHCCAITATYHVTQQWLCHLRWERARCCLLWRFFPAFISLSVSECVV